MLTPPRRTINRHMLPAILLALLAGCTGTTEPPGTPTSSASTTSSAASLDRQVDLMLSGGERYDRLIKSVIVQLHGKPVVQHYAADSGPDVTHDLFSVTKSVMSMLIGIAIGDGSIGSVDDRLAVLLPDRVRGMAPGVGDITLRQILTMTAGIFGDEPFDDRYRNAKADWTALTLSTALVQPAGTGFIYASAGSHLLSAILVEATGRTVLDYARAKLFDPLGIVTRPAAEPPVDLDMADYRRLPGFAWTVDPTGLHLGFTDIKLAAPDMVKLGQLYLDEGSWHGKQVVPAAWVTASTARVVDTDGQLGYGYQWWVDTPLGHPAFSAFGRAGQLIEVVPDLDLVVAVSSIDDPAEFNPSDVAELVSAYVIPAVGG